MEKGCVLSKASAVLLGVFFVVVVVAVGLLAGLVGRETCEVDRDGSSDAVVIQPTADPATPTPYPPGPWDNVRLPLSLLPETYDVLLKIDLENFVFSGNVEILMLCNTSATEIIVHTNKLNISKVRFTDDDGSARDITDYWFHLPNQFLVVPAGKALRVGQMYRLYVEFVGPLKDDLAGLYLSQYTGSDGNPR
ncbi:ANPEP [Branchiostoma lanceolatum]|uniref:ANPEP protein n=1 Tax=Branchiostoma lanceolatum TaxID=7740 RepID=A0A8K0EKV3_BRALA|nr:ANPEP [Branchiostoma lanceolatum]